MLHCYLTIIYNVKETHFFVEKCRKTDILLCHTTLSNHYEMEAIST